MGDTEKCSNTTDHMIQRLHSSFGTSSSSTPKHATAPIHHHQQQQQQLDLNPNFLRSSTTPTSPQFPQFSKPFSDCAKRIGVPPSHPNLIPPPTSPFSQIPTSRQPASLHSHSRSLSQPNSFFSFDSLPPLSPSPFRDSLSAAQLPDHDVSMEDPDSAGFSLPPSSPFTRCNSSTSSTSSVRAGESLPPRKSHRRSSSDIPSGFNNSMNSLPLIPPRPLERSFSGGECADWSKSAPFVKKESSCDREGVGDREAMDDLFSAYMNLENIDVLNSSEAEDSKNGGGTNENRDDMDSSRASGTKTNNGSDTEGESSSVNESANTGVKRRAAGGDIAPTTRHYRSVSVDSCFMEKLSFGDESLKPPLSPGTISRKVSPTNSVDGNSGAAAFSIEFKNGEFTAAELKKIMANDKLAEMAMSDPKRVKRILANRQSAARSKERKMRYIVELEHKVQTLQTEATTLSAQLTLLQREMIGLTNQNNELKFRLQAMEQQARLRDALNEALNGEVQRLKLAIGETSHNGSERSKMQSLNAEMFQQLNISQLRQQPQQSSQNQNGTMALATKPESNE
ncbi:PREDICTED: probable transcription factor PosF21 [Camelina sativa]|uniref:Probable transcription factor PosF21 n=1 Tax=Camelina sativa TaxID=90675 RepID=A0ABM0TUW8_CAMSA|nr:PREDICTED: probable transcription factor PosF21 [Camelina sativa]XP_010431839.1 PREDICTED: probable transcription factor PosF21 [Camelina sativa]